MQNYFGQQLKNDDNKVCTKTFIMHLLYAIFFAVLFLERVIVFLYSLIKYNSQIFASFSVGYLYILEFLLLVFCPIYLLKTNAVLFKSAFTFDKKTHDKIDVLHLCIAIGVMSFSSLINLHHSVIILQVLGCVCALVAIILQMSLNKVKSRSVVLVGFSVFYLAFCYLMISLAFEAKGLNPTIFSIIKTATSLFFSSILVIYFYNASKGKSTDFFIAIPMALSLFIYFFIINT